MEFRLKFPAQVSTNLKTGFILYLFLKSLILVSLISKIDAIFLSGNPFFLRFKIVFI